MPRKRFSALSRQPASRFRSRGFSLIEMVAAFLVFAIAMGVLMGVLTASMHNARASADYTMAALWAESKLDTVGVGEPVEEGQTRGRFDDTYGWTLDIRLVDAAEVAPQMQTATSLGARGVPGGSQMQSHTGKVSVSQAGNGNGIDTETPPFDLYQVDLVVSWGGQEGGRQHMAHFGTLRAVNPDPNQALNANGQHSSLPSRNLGGNR